MYLLDTNALIILLFGQVTTAKLSKESMDILENSDDLYLSEISLWEIAIKIKIGKIAINESLETITDKCVENGIKMIPVGIGQFGETLRLPMVKDHSDPFDRLIICVAKLYQLSLISCDAKMKQNESQYGITVLD